MIIAHFIGKKKAITMDKIPDRIFLQIHEDAEVENINEVSDIDEGNVTWCKDKIYPTDVEYVRAKSPWISIEDKYPEYEPSIPDEKKTRYLVRVIIGSIMPTVGYCVAYVAGKSRFNVDMDWNKVTHWMPIPIIN